MKKKLHILIQERAVIAKEGRTLADNMAQDDYDTTKQEADDKTLADLAAKLIPIDADIEKATASAERAAPFAARDDVIKVPATAIDRDEEARGGFRDLAEYALAVVDAANPKIRDLDPRLLAVSVHSEGGSATGDGFMVPAQMAAGIYEVAVEQTDLFNLTLMEQTSGNQIQVMRDVSTPWGSTGIQAAWRGESDQMAKSNLETDMTDLKLNQLYAFATATEELLEDGPLLNSRLQRGAAGAIAWKLDDAIFRGDGVGKPEGFTESGAFISQAKVTSQTADTVNATNILNMYTRMFPASLSNAVWLANPEVMPQLATMTLGDQPIYLPPGGLTAAPHGVLMGRPVIYTGHANALGDLGDITFVDLQGYNTVNKAGGTKFAESIHLRFDYNERAFRWVLRVGGQTFLSAAVSPEYGSATQSHFVGLAVRE